MLVALGAISGISAGLEFTFSPTPSTVYSMPVRDIVLSTRIPDTLHPSSFTSLGHLMVVSSPVASPTVDHTASAAAMLT